MNFGFHPLIESWFSNRFAEPTEPQRRGWPEIAQGIHTLIAAPTGSGKTLTAFLCAIDELWKKQLDGTAAGYRLEGEQGKRQAARRAGHGSLSIFRVAGSIGIARAE